MQLQGIIRTIYIMLMHLFTKKIACWQLADFGCVFTRKGHTPAKIFWAHYLHQVKVQEDLFKKIMKRHDIGMTTNMPSPELTSVVYTIIIVTV